MRTSLILTIALLASLAFPALGAAKGPAAATITGPGISGIRHLSGDSEGGSGTSLGALTMDGGFFPQVFGQSPNPTSSVRPQGELGPRYSITYKMPGPGGAVSLHQDLYPYASPAPLTYMKPGQVFWDGQRTRGGWFTAGGLHPRALGLPAQPPTAGGAHARRWPWVGGGGVALAAAIVFLVLRRRNSHAPRPASA